MARQPVRNQERLQITLFEDNRLEVWTREGMSGEEFARLLREMADRFESGDVTRRA